MDTAPLGSRYGYAVLKETGCTYLRCRNGTATPC